MTCFRGRLCLAALMAMASFIGAAELSGNGSQQNLVKPQFVTVNLQDDGSVIGVVKTVKPGTGDLVPSREARVSFAQGRTVMTHVRTNQSGEFVVHELQPGIEYSVVASGQGMYSSFPMTVTKDGVLDSHVSPLDGSCPVPCESLDITLSSPGCACGLVDDCVEGGCEVCGETCVEEEITEPCGWDPCAGMPFAPAYGGGYGGGGGSGGGGFGSLAGLAGLAGLAALIDDDDDPNNLNPGVPARPPRLPIRPPASPFFP